MELVPIITLVQAALAAAPAVATGAAEAAVSGVAGAVAGAAEAAVSGVAGAAEAAVSGVAGAAQAAPEAITTSAGVAAGGVQSAPQVAGNLAAGAAQTAPQTAGAIAEAAPGTAVKITAETAASNITGLDIARYGLVVGSIGLGTTQGVLAYQAGEEAKRAKEAQARAIQAAGERRIGQLRKEALRYENILRARAGAAGLGFEGSPAILGQEALGSVTAEAETIRSNAASAGAMLRREGRAASLAGRIGLGTGIGSGLVNAGQIALRVYG